MKSKTSEKPSFRDLLVKEIDDIKVQIAELQLNLSKAEGALETYDMVRTFTKKKAPVKPKMVRKKFNTPAQPDVVKRTAADRFEFVLEKFKVPLTSSEILKAMNEAFPDKKLEPESWSPQLSNIYKDPKRPFQRIEFSGNPNETKYFYGLKKWFDGDALKDEYFKKLSSRHKIYTISETTLFKTA